MADMEEESNPFHQNETKIPVFTVVKNGAILKNIFIVNDVQDRENEDVIILGRHPDCNIMLTHPSISRFHLQIQTIPSSLKLCVVDLSSVHGTWVSGKRTEAGDRVEMREGDTLRVGGSSRVYTLYWVPLSSAYDFQCPTEMKEDEVAIVEEKAVVDCEKEISLLDENKETVEDLVFDNIEPLYSDENWTLEMMKEIPLAPSGDGVETVSDLRNECEQEETSLLTMPFGNELRSLEMSFQSPSLPLSAESFNAENIIMSSFFVSESKSSSSRTLEQDNIYKVESPQPPYLPPPAENLSFNVENIIMSSFFGSESKSSSSRMLEQDDIYKVESPQPPSLPLSAENLSFNVESIIMSSSFGSESMSSSSRTLEQDNTYKVESPQPPSLPLSAENLSFNVENIIMSSFFDGDETKMFEWEETNSIWTIPLENKSNILSMVDEIKATQENGYQQLDDENKSLQSRSTSPCIENSSDVQDTAMDAFAGGECKSSSRNELESKEISNIVTIPLGHELSHIAVIEDEKPISDNERRQFENENGRLLANVGDVETQYLPVHEVKSSSTEPLVALQSETVTEKNEFKEEHELHPPEDNHSSISTEKGNWEMEMLNESQSEVGEDNVDKGDKELYQRYQVIECLQDCQSQYKNDSSVKTTSEVTPNSPVNPNVECCVEDKNNARLETLEPSKSVTEKDYEHKELSEPSFVPCAMEFDYTSSLLDEEVSPKIVVKRESQTPDENVDATSLVGSENLAAMGGSIWLRRGKPTSFPRIKTGASRANRVGTSLMDEFNHEIAGDETVANNTLLYPLGGEVEEEIFTPDKENFTPNTLLMKTLKKKANIEDSENSFSSSKSQTSIFKSRHKLKQEEELSEESDKENQTPRVLQEQKLAKQILKNRRFGKEKIVPKRGGAERAPFQSLQSNLAEKKRPEATVVKSARKSNISASTRGMKNKFTVEGKKRWTMVVDINSLLNKESMKSLHLLQGLQGTHLIVPRIVIRELDCLRRHGSLFRKATEAASILQWVEDCMVQTRWWISVQSSQDSGEPPATPPATPQSPYSEGTSQSLLWRTASSIQSITHRSFSFMQALSPTPEDHILDCALHFRRGVNHGQLVLLSNDVTLKIKAMAEGLICETAKEFRESLVNPFSERFLWADSSPRGLTWSCPDDVVLRERYDRCSSRSSKGAEGAKGLKLILLHNSHYGMLR